jgi:hypothetical protein
VLRGEEAGSCRGLDYSGEAGGSGAGGAHAAAARPEGRLLPLLAGLRAAH